MHEQSVVVAGAAGLHARPAALFVQAAQAFEAQIWVQKGEKRVDGRSLLGLLGLGAVAGTSLLIRAEGPDSAAAVARLADLVQSGFSEA